MSRKLLVILLLLAMWGCGQEQQQPKPQQAKPQIVPQVKQPYQRFVPMTSGIRFALDTKTGQLCTTFMPTREDEWDRLPPCFDLYKQYPD